MPKLFVINGGIAVGKTTMVGEISKKYDIKDWTYVNRDFYRDKKYFPDLSFDDRDELAKDVLSYKVNELIKQKKNVILEMVIAKDDKVDIIKKFAQNNYEITMFFVYVDGVKTSQERKSKRNSEVDFYITDEYVRKKYFKSKEFLSKLEPLVDQIIYVNNAKNKNVKSDFNVENFLHISSEDLVKMNELKEAYIAKNKCTQ